MTTVVACWIGIDSGSDLCMILEFQTPVYRARATLPEGWGGGVLPDVLPYTVGSKISYQIRLWTLGGLCLTHTDLALDLPVS